MRYDNGKIYRITNNIDSMIYIGSTCLPLRKRLYSHKKEQHSGKGQNRRLFLHAKKYGKETKKKQDQSIQRTRPQRERILELRHPRKNSRAEYRQLQNPQKVWCEEDTNRRQICPQSDAAVARCLTKSRLHPHQCQPEDADVVSPHHTEPKPHFQEEFQQKRGQHLAKTHRFDREIRPAAARDGGHGGRVRSRGVDSTQGVHQERRHRRSQGWNNSVAFQSILRSVFDM